MGNGVVFLDGVLTFFYYKIFVFENCFLFSKKIRDNTFGLYLVAIFEKYLLF